LEVIEEEALLPEVEKKGQLFEEALQHPKVKEIRRKGLFFAFEFATANEVQQIVEYCLDHQVICFWFLSNPNSFRIAPPLNISYSEIKKACTIIRQAFDTLK